MGLVNRFIEDNPPLPLLPKTLAKIGESPRSGGNCGLLKLTKFRGQDYGKSKMSKHENIDRVSWPGNVYSLKQVFTPVENIKHAPSHIVKAAEKYLQHTESVDNVRGRKSSNCEPDR